MDLKNTVLFSAKTRRMNSLKNLEKGRKMPRKKAETVDVMSLLKERPQEKKFSVLLVIDKSVRVQSKDERGKRVRKHYFCYFCGKCYKQKIAPHYLSVHSKEKKVQEILGKEKATRVKGKKMSVGGLERS